VSVTDRRVPFEGVPNFRDLGGYPTRSGARVRWGLVFRAGVLDGFRPADLTLYDQLGLRTVFDLRSDTECDERPSMVTSRRLTITGRPPGDERITRRQLPRTAAEGEQLLHEIYCGLLDHSAAQIGELLVALTADGGLPAAFHCHAGKDRTGMVAALLLEALGVERTLVLDDYELTTQYLTDAMVQDQRTFARLIELGFSEEAAAAVFATSRWAMEAALDHMDSRHGGVESYLTGPAGMTREHLEVLRERLLEPPPIGSGR
jgi:protein-tyrosine phosphatase